MRGAAIAGTDASTDATKPAQTTAASKPKPPAKPSSTKSSSTKSSSGARAPAKRSSIHQTSSAQKKSSHGKKGSKQIAKKRGQQVIDSDRTREIQTALIREHYMQGEPTGTWDASTQAAMQRFQTDQGWQSKQIPDSRALIKLGLGPSHDHLLNPESAMTTTLTPASSPTTTTTAPADPKAAPKQTPPANDVPQQ